MNPLSPSSLPTRQPGGNLTPGLREGVNPSAFAAPAVENVLPAPNAEARVMPDNPLFPGEPAAAATTEQPDPSAEAGQYVAERHMFKALGNTAFGRPGAKTASVGSGQPFPEPTGKGYETLAEAEYARAEGFKDLAYHDTEVTGLMNRLGLNEWFRENRPKVAGVMLLDIKNFREFNAIFDHAGGDEALKVVAKQLTKKLRTGSEPDKAPHAERRVINALDMVARNSTQSEDAVAGRYGGDEFMAVIDLSEVPEASREFVMERISERIKDMGTFSMDGKVDAQGDKIELPLSMHSDYRISADPNETLDRIYGSFKTDELKSDKLKTTEPANKQSLLRRILSGFRRQTPDNR